MRSVAVAFLTLCLVAAASAGFARDYRRTERYDGQKLYECSVNSESKNSLMRLINEAGFDLWKVHSHSIEFRATPLLQMKYEKMLSRCTVLVDDVEILVRSWEKDMVDQSLKEAEWFEAYHTYEELVNWYSDLASQYPNIVTFIPSIGKSYEGRNQPAVRITGLRGSNKPSIYFQCQIHAREWISGATCNYIVNELVTQYGANGTVTNLLDSLVFHIVPFTNPDGYVYTWTNDRLWRKNRKVNSGALCLGVDVNRNYNSKWGQGGSSTSPCSDTYMGSAANSEIETKNTINYFTSIAPVIGAIDWHSYSQLILRPYGWTRNDSPDEAFLKRVGDGMRDVIRSVSGVSYTSQKSIDLYVTTGTAQDWFYENDDNVDNKGYKAAGFTIELRDTGRYGFELPANQIIPTGQENYAAVIYFANQVLVSPIRV